MSIYQLPKLEITKIPTTKIKFWRSQIFWIIILSIFVSSFFGFLAGSLAGGSLSSDLKGYVQGLLNLKNVPQTSVQEESQKYSAQTTEEKTVMEVSKETLPSVVSVVITKEVEYWDQFFPFGPPAGTQKQEVGRGTGFMVSEDGLIITNKHVASISGGDYAVVTNEGKRYNAKVLALDPGQDLAVLKIEANNLPVLKFGNSDNLEIGQTVIAVGNALGEFGNTVSVGVVSGLSRTITASGGGLATEVLTGLIQTDAAINQGNSGGPLLNLRGEVIGVNTAMALGAENIGFAVPANLAKRDAEQVKATGKITYPFLGVGYIAIDGQTKEEKNLPVDYGAWITSWSKETGQWVKSSQTAVVPGSAADKAGLKENDIILEVNNEKIAPDNPLAEIISKYKPGDQINLKILRNKEEKMVTATLEERKN